MPSTPAVLAEARAHFADHCAVCHDADGSGHTAMGQGTSPRAPDLRQPASQSLSDGELFWIVENGVRFTGMPAWGKPGRAEESWNLVHLIRRLPNLTESGRADIESAMPRSPSEWREQQEEERFLQAPQPCRRRPRSPPSATPGTSTSFAPRTARTARR